MFGKIDNSFEAKLASALTEVLRGSSSNFQNRLKQVRPGFDEGRTSAAFDKLAGGDDLLRPRELLGALKPFVTTNDEGEQVLDRDGFVDAAMSLGVRPEHARKAFETLAGGKDSVPVKSVADFANERARPDGNWRFADFRDVVRDLAGVGRGSAGKGEPKFGKNRGAEPAFCGSPGYDRNSSDKRRFDEGRTRAAFGKLAGADDLLEPQELFGGLKPFVIKNDQGEQVLDREGFVDAATTLGVRPDAARKAYAALADGQGNVSVDSVADFAGERARPDGTWRFTEFRDVVRDLSGVGNTMAA